MKRTNLAAIAALLSFALAASAETNAVERVKVAVAPAPTVDAFDVSPVPLAEEVVAEASETATVPKADERGEWYERIEAKPGSRAYWVVFAAREKAKRGEDVAHLRRVMSDTLAKWFSVPFATGDGDD